MTARAILQECAELCGRLLERLAALEEAQRPSAPAPTDGGLLDDPMAELLDTVRDGMAGRLEQPKVLHHVLEHLRGAAQDGRIVALGLAQLADGGEVGA